MSKNIKAIARVLRHQASDLMKLADQIETDGYSPFISEEKFAATLTSIAGWSCFCHQTDQCPSGWHCSRNEMAVEQSMRRTESTA